MALVIALFCGVLQGLGFDQLWRYDRDLVNAGEYWRWLSAHFVHLGWTHYWMNMGALGLLWLMFAPRYRSWEWLFIFVISSILQSLVLHWNNLSLYYYVGLSGTLHAVIGAGLWREWRFDRTFTMMVAVLMGVKLLYEQFVGPMPGSEESAGGNVIVDAHFYGAIAGIICAAALSGIRALFPTLNADKLEN